MNRLSKSAGPDKNRLDQIKIDFQNWYDLIRIGNINLIRIGYLYTYHTEQRERCELIFDNSRSKTDVGNKTSTSSVTTNLFKILILVYATIWQLYFLSTNTIT